MNRKPTALIAEDEPLLAEHLRQQLAALWPELDIIAMATSGPEALEAALRLQPAICFLDIRMPGMTGLELAQALAEDWPDEAAAPFPLLVFVTAYDEYALQAFERAAVDYVLKPVQTERLARTCERLRGALSTAPAAPTAGELSQGTQGVVAQLRELLAVPGLAQALGQQAPQTAAPLRVLQVSVGSAIQMVPIGDVVYFEAADKYVRVLTADREYLIRASLRELLPQLDAQVFWQVHRSVVVRIDAVERAQRDEAGRLSLQLRRRPERLNVSRMHAHLFKGL